MPQLPKISAVGIVIVGGMNPSIFHPTWFAEQGLAPAYDPQDQSFRPIMVPDLTQVVLGSFHLQVTTDRMEWTTADQSEYGRLRDIAAGTLSVLPHMPVRAMGINHNAHFELTEDRWNRVGHTIVPKDRWGFLKNPGTRSVTVEGERSDDFPGYIRVTMEPSAQVHFGVYIAVNDHFQFEPDDKPPTAAGAAKARQVLDEQWTAVSERSQTCIENVIGMAF